MYDVSLKRKWDAESIRQTAIIERERAIERAKQEAKQEAEYNKAVAIALEFKKMGIPFESIAKGTGLSIREIEKL